jgi:hypothetical protein
MKLAPKTIGWQIRLAIRFGPKNRIYFEIFGNNFVFVPQGTDERLVYGRCTFENESRFWQMTVSGIVDRRFHRVEVKDLEPYRREIADYLDSTGQAGSVVLQGSANPKA